MFYTIPHIGYMKLDKKGFLNNNESTSNDITKYGYAEGALIEWCKENCLSAEKNFIDIGAHNGTWSISLGEKAVKTYSFECNIEPYCCLCGNIYLKGLCDKVIPHNIGLSNTHEIKQYHIRSSDGGGNGFTELGKIRDESSLIKYLEVKTLDSFNLENIGFIKIDVEGHEKEVLEGAVNTLKNNGYPSIIFESWAEWREDNEHFIPARKLRKELFEYVKSLGYTIRPINHYDEMFIASK
jgi:FkbM family methyltransferase